MMQSQPSSVVSTVGYANDPLEDREKILELLFVLAKR